MQKILILATGGTIAGEAASATDTVGYKGAQRGVEQLVADVPPLAGLPLEMRQIANIDSSSMDFAIWRTLALAVTEALEREEVAGVVITHGTDSLEETAYFLHRVVDAVKPVVLTAAMRPATALENDGRANLFDAVTVAGTPGAHGVVCVLDGHVHGAEDVAKRHPYRTDAFDGGEAGPIAAVESGVLHMWRAWPLSRPIVGAHDLPGDPQAWPWVEVVLNCSGVNGNVARVLVAQEVDGIVVAGSGNGNIHHALVRALHEAEAAGVAVVRTTRVGDGRVLGPDVAGISKGESASPVKARIALLLTLLKARLEQSQAVGQGRDA